MEMGKFGISTLRAGVALMALSVSASAAVHTVSDTPAAPGTLVASASTGTLHLNSHDYVPGNEPITDLTLQVSPADDQAGDSAEPAFLGYFQLNSLGTLTATTRAVPEPTSVALLGVGLAGLGMARRRRGPT